MTRTHRLLLGAACLLLPITMRAASPQELASQVKLILKNNCYHCHGERGAAEGGMAYVTDLAKLVERKKVLPGNPVGSKLFKKMASEDDPMPPLTDDDNKPITQRPSKDQVALVRQWIEAGAPNGAAAAVAVRAFMSDDDIFVAIQKDLRAADERSRTFLRYFTITHLYNAGLSEDELQTYRGGLSKLVNSLSWGRRIVVPAAIDEQKTVFRIDLRDYKWNEETWKKILGSYPYKISRFTPAVIDVRDLNKTDYSFVRADWFVFAASRPPLYHDVLDLPKTDAELEKLLKVDVAEDIRTERVARAGFNGSGVSRNNRLIERHDSPYGAYWKSYDFKRAESDRKNLFAHPLGPGEKQENFEQDGGEIIFNLPNGLQAYMLINGKGERIDKGPLEVVSDPKQEDRSVVNGVSCMSCHAKGMIEKSDQVRDTVLGNAAGYDPTTVDLVKALYPAKADFDALLKDDADRFATAVERSGAAKTKSEPVVSLALRFQTDLDTALAAAEAGLSPDEFRGAIAGSSRLAPKLGALTIPGGTVQRDVYVAAFSDLVERATKLRYLRKPRAPDPVSLADLQRRADAGEPAAMYDLAIRCQVANGVPTDLPKALALLRAAADKGYVPAMLRLADMYGGPSLNFLHFESPSVLGVQTDLAQAVAWLNRAVDAGSPTAMLELATSYESGEGVEKDAAKGALLRDRAFTTATAAPANDPSASFCLFIIEVSRKDDKKEEKKDDQKEMFDKLFYAAQHGEPRAAGLFSLILFAGTAPRDLEYPMEMMHHAANLGDLQSMVFLASVLENVDAAQAIAWYQKGVDAGMTKAMGDLAAMYRNGIFVPKDDRRATQLVHQAAEAGDHYYMVDLAQSYEAGIGIPQDHQQAIQWMRKAAALEKDDDGSARKWLKEHGETP